MATVKLPLKLARQRGDFYFKLAGGLVKEFDFIVVEDLNIQVWMQGDWRKGVHDAGWGFFPNGILPDEAWRAGRVCVQVSPNGASQQLCLVGRPCAQRPVRPSAYLPALWVDHAW